MGAGVIAGWLADQGRYGSLQAAVPLDKERGLALLSGSLLMAALELALPLKVAVLQQMQEQGRTIRAHQREEPDDLQLARQQIEGLLQQIQPEPYKLYERWEILVTHERGNRRTGNVIHDLWRHLPEQTRLGPEWAGEPRRFTGLLQEARGLFIKLHQDRHHAAHSKADTTFHAISWHVAVLRLGEIPLELQSSARMILEMSTGMPASIRAGMGQALVVLDEIDTRSLIAHVEHSFVRLAADRTKLGEVWGSMHPGMGFDQERGVKSDELTSLREELSILHDRFASLSGALGPVLGVHHVARPDRNSTLAAKLIVSARPSSMCAAGYRVVFPNTLSSVHGCVDSYGTSKVVVERWLWKDYLKVAASVEAKLGEAEPEAPNGIASFGFSATLGQAPQSLPPLSPAWMNRNDLFGPM